MIEKIALNVPGGTHLEPVAGMPEGSGQSIQNFLQWGVTVLFIVATLLALAFLIMGGIQWIKSGGDKAALDAARKKITYAIVGLVVAFSAFLVINSVSYFFGINLLDPGCKVNQHRLRIPGPIPDPCINNN